MRKKLFLLLFVLILFTAFSASADNLPKCNANGECVIGGSGKLCVSKSDCTADSTNEETEQKEGIESLIPISEISSKESAGIDTLIKKTNSPTIVVAKSIINVDPKNTSVYNVQPNCQAPYNTTGICMDESSCTGTVLRGQVCKGGYCCPGLPNNVLCCVPSETPADTTILGELSIYSADSQGRHNSALQLINGTYYVPGTPAVANKLVVVPRFSIPTELKNTHSDKKIWIWMALDPESKQSYFTNAEDAEKLKCFYPEKDGTWDISVEIKDFYWVDGGTIKLMKEGQWLNQAGQFENIPNGMLKFNPGQAAQSGNFFAKYLKMNQNDSSITDKAVYWFEAVNNVEDMWIYTVTESADGKAQGQEVQSGFGVIAGHHLENVGLDYTNNTYYFKYCVAVSNESKPILSKDEVPAWNSALLAVGKQPVTPVTATADCATCSTISQCLGCIDKDKFVPGVFE